METKKTILIADTSEEFRTVLAEAIQAEEGLEVVGQTGDGQEAIQLVQDRDPDVLVMDLVLERMDGFDVLEAVKARPMSTLILSSFARGCMADQVAARGGDYYMMKPCRIASVVERVRLLAAQHWSEGEEGAASPASARQTLEANVTAIIDLMMDSLNKRLEDKQIRVEVTEAAKDFIVAESYDPAFGARPLRRYIQHTIETLIGRKIIAEDLAPGTVLTVDLDGNTLFIR